MGEALSIKDTVRSGDPAVSKPKTHAEEVATNRVRCWVDNQTGEVYDGPENCFNGCYQLVGEEAEKAIARGSGPKQTAGMPQFSAEELEDRELERRKTADAERAEAERKTAADAKPAADSAGEKAKAKSANKARKNKPATK